MKLKNRKKLIIEYLNQLEAEYNNFFSNSDNYDSNNYLKMWKYCKNVLGIDVKYESHLGPEMVFHSFITSLRGELIKKEKKYNIDLNVLIPAIIAQIGTIIIAILGIVL